ncbi:phosphoribosylanthranilate isomerase [Alkanindiges illinoisensis]|uniref:phosphoribosylanthranilate isomerase n=1 Tax=Alkanindiges illinoisensis TaxID=197183 RepID=UPI000A802C15|nr:phosphoribosylanthranilate isomerase [Alkanindiges illinoisensis]
MTDKLQVRAKICGLTRAEDVQCAVAAGADAIGLVFYAPSPRAVSVEKAQTLLAVVTPFVQVAGLFVNATVAEIQQVLSQVALDILQLHGDETPTQCAEIGQLTGRRWIKALAVKPDSNVPELIEQYIAAGASGILLDTWHPQLKGGTGQTFDWDSWPQTTGKTVPLILAGGLNPDNVADAIAQTRPYAVDVSGGVESQKGIKDHQLIRKFMQGVQRG